MSTLDASIDAKLLAPWPTDALRERLLQGDTLERLTGPGRKSPGYDTREHYLEAVAQQVMIDTFGHSALMPARRSISRILNLVNAPFPGRSMPDIAIHHGGKVHILEVKSSRTDYGRFDRVVTRGLEQYLIDIGEGAVTPWEVEQDLIRLLLYPGMSSDVGSCLFVMVDAYEHTRGESWTDVFSSLRKFHETMKTKLIRDQAGMLLQATTIQDLATTNASARLITCLVHPWQR